jgi:uncharacterized integral membrane protein
MSVKSYATIQENEEETVLVPSRTPSSIASSFVMRFMYAAVAVLIVIFAVANINVDGSKLNFLRFNEQQPAGKCIGQHGFKCDH